MVPKFVYQLGNGLLGHAGTLPALKRFLSQGARGRLEVFEVILSESDKHLLEFPDHLSDAMIEVALKQLVVRQIVVLENQGVFLENEQLFLRARQHFFAEQEIFQGHDGG